MFWHRPRFALTTDRMVLRLPEMDDYDAWLRLRRDSAAFLLPWEPARSADYDHRRAFRQRVWWARRALAEGRGLALLLFRRQDNEMLGGLSLDNLRYGPARTGTLGYWLGQQHTRQGHMSEAVRAAVAHAFGPLDLSRIEAACLPENAASRAVLESCGFKYEGVAQSYLQIAGRWRTHVLYANLRADRRGRTDAGIDEDGG